MIKAWKFCFCPGRSVSDVAKLVNRVGVHFQSFLFVCQFVEFVAKWIPHRVDEYMAKSLSSS